RRHPSSPGLLPDVPANPDAWRQYRGGQVTTLHREDESRTADRRSWIHDALVYQIYPRSFADGDGDGLGDIRGIIDRVPYLSGLGVDAVWLSPFYPSPLVDGGYDAEDHRAVDPRLGTLADVDELIAALHAADIRL